MQLLKITTTPIKYRIESEQATLTAVNPDSVRKTENRVHNQRIIISKEGASFHDSVNHDRDTVPSDSKRIRTDKSYEKTIKTHEGNKPGFIYQYSRNNDKVQNVHNRAEKTVTGHSYKSNIDVAFSQIKSAKPDVSWEPDRKIRTNSKAETGDISSKKFEFTPPSCKLIVEELADVKIEYLGGIDYFPESSAPDYEEKDEA